MPSEPREASSAACGHDPAQFVTADEGTSYCPACEDEARCVCGEINTRHCPVHGQDEVESAATRLRNPSADTWEARYNRALAERDNARGELGRLSEVVKNAARPLSRLRLSHSPACPYVHGEDGSLGGTCVCGVAEIEELAALAQKVGS